DVRLAFGRTRDVESAQLLARGSEQCVTARTLIPAERGAERLARDYWQRIMVPRMRGETARRSARARLPGRTRPPGERRTKFRRQVLGVDRAMWALVLVALAVRLAAVAATPHYVPVSDPLDYERYALAIQHGHFPPRGGGDPGPTAYRPPLYPLFLGTVYRLSPGDPRVAARVVQAFVGALTVLLAGVVARQLFGRRIALVTM